MNRDPPPVCTCKANFYDKGDSMCYCSSNFCGGDDSNYKGDNLRAFVNSFKLCLWACSIRLDCRRGNKACPDSVPTFYILDDLQLHW